MVFLEGTSRIFDTLLPLLSYLKGKVLPEAEHKISLLTVSIDFFQTIRFPYTNLNFNLSLNLQKFLLLFYADLIISSQIQDLIGIRQVSVLALHSNI